MATNIVEELLQGGRVQLRRGPISSLFIGDMIRTIGLYAIIWWPFRDTLTLTLSNISVGHGWLFNPNKCNEIDIERVESLAFSQNKVEEAAGVGDIIISTNPHGLVFAGDGKKDSLDLQPTEEILDIQNPKLAKALFLLAKSEPAEREKRLAEAIKERPNLFEWSQKTAFRMIQLTLGLFIFWLFAAIALAILTQQWAFLLLIPLIFLIGIVGMIIHP